MSNYTVEKFIKSSLKIIFPIKKSMSEVTKQKIKTRRKYALTNLLNTKGLPYRYADILTEKEKTTIILFLESYVKEHKKIKKNNPYLELKLYTVDSPNNRRELFTLYSSYTGYNYSKLKSITDELSNFEDVPMYITIWYKFLMQNIFSDINFVLQEDNSFSVITSLYYLDEYLEQIEYLAFVSKINYEIEYLQ